MDTYNQLQTKQLRKDDILADVQYREIARLIYDTDRFIYPALFSGNSNLRFAAERTISKVLIEGSDQLYCKDNLFICLDKNKIVGMVLWYQGPLLWDYKRFIQAAADIGVYLKSDNVKDINDIFFGSQKYEEMANNGDKITLFNICVDSSVRGRGIGSFMLKSFIAKNEKQEMELSVLKENSTAIKLYSNSGFEITDEYSGFSQSSLKPICYKMKREGRPSCNVIF